MDQEQVFADLDKHAAEFNFPALDNAYVEFAAARLSAFRGERDWIIAFEVLGFSIREVQFVNHVYAYGSCLGQEGFIGEEIPIVELGDGPLFAPDTREPIIDWSHWRVQLKGQVRAFSPSRDDYRKAGIAVSDVAGPGSLKEIDLMRYLVHVCGEDLFMSTGELLGLLPQKQTLPLFLSTTEWQHPDISEGEMPSQSLSIRSLVAALSSGKAGLFDQGRSNTDWTFWANRSATE